MGWDRIQDLKDKIEELQKEYELYKKHGDYDSAISVEEEIGDLKWDLHGLLQGRVKELKEDFRGELDE